MTTPSTTQTPDRTLADPRFPVELVNIIIDNIRRPDGSRDTRTLHSLCAVDRRFRILSTAPLYETFDSRYGNVSKLLHTLYGRNDLAKHFKRIIWGEGFVRKDDKGHVFLNPGNGENSNLTSGLSKLALGSDDVKEPNERGGSEVDRLGADVILEGLLIHTFNLKHFDYKHAGGASSPMGVPWRLFVTRPMRRSFEHLHTVKITIKFLVRDYVRLLFSCQSIRYLEITQYIDSPGLLYKVPVGSSNVETLKLKQSCCCGPNLASFVAGCRKLRTFMYEHWLPTPHVMFDSEPSLDLRVLEPALRRHRESLRHLILTMLARDIDSYGHFSTLQDFRVLNSVVCPADSLQRPQEETSVMIQRFGSLFPGSMKHLMVTIDTTAPDFDWEWSPYTLKPHSCLSTVPAALPGLSTLYLLLKSTCKLARHPWHRIQKTFMSANMELDVLHEDVSDDGTYPSMEVRDPDFFPLAFEEDVGRSWEEFIE
ncbi:hypothetical protein BKA63DRAFT_572258 [Paraphoma chrysanthemicola]|nr:hypothetical protein BKA63DRAFT_572258 [Paraphoma chrysanthemicola]